jgi:CheY-like chemotaxis protein
MVLFSGLVARMLTNMGPRVLLVDDDPDVRALAHQMIDLELEDFPHEVIEVSNGHDAVTLCETTMPDCIVLDMHMPGMSGLEVLRVLMQKPRAPWVIAWSADDVAVRAALDSGATLGLDKARDVARLAQAVRSCLVYQAG